MRSFVVPLVLVGFLGVFGCGAAFAQSGGADIKIDVVDGGGAPVSGAHLFLIGGSIESNQATATDSKGLGEFQGVADGEYRLTVKKNGFSSATQVFDVAGLDIGAKVVLLSLPTIASVKASASTVSISTESTRKELAFKISKSLYDAIDQLGAARVQVGLDGQPLGVSIGGQDISNTTYSENGVVVSNPIASHAFDPDLLSGAVVDQDSDQVNLLFLSPTSDWHLRDTQTLGGFAYSTNKAETSGTSGNLGYALVGVNRNAQSALNGATYLDSSGLTYEHEGTLAARSYMGALSLQANSDVAITVRGVLGNRDEIPLPAYYDGAAPYGYGPGANEYAVFREVVPVVSITLSNALLTLSSGTLTGGVSLLAPNRTLAGTELPFTEGYSSIGRTLGLDYSVAIPSNPHLFIWNSSSAAFSSIDGAGFNSEATAGGVSATTIQYSEHVVYTNALDILAKVASVAQPGSPFVSGGSINATLHVNKDQDAQLTFLDTVSGTHTPGGGAFDDPASVRYTCAGSSAQAQGIGDAGTPSRIQGLAASYAAKLSQNEDSLAVSAFSKDISGAVLSQAIVPATSEPNGYLPAGYIGEIQQGFVDYSGCGGPSPQADSVYILQSISGVHLGYRGIDLRFSNHIGPRAVAQGYADLLSARLLSDDPRLDGPTSPYIVGHQLPNQPTFVWGLTLAQQIGARSQAFVGINGSASNNQNNLPANLEVNAGLEVNFSKLVTLDIVGINVTNQYVGLFASPEYAVPLPTRTGRLFENAAPLQQPELFARLNIGLQH
jgi:hypothetical protein